MRVRQGRAAEGQGVESLLGRWGIECKGLTAARVEAYLDLLEQWNRKVNLTGIRGRTEILRDLFAESFLAASLLAAEDGPLLDVGSGAGFPGMALKIFRPELSVYLLEPRAKRAGFLETVRRRLGLEGVFVMRKRLEECLPSDFVLPPRTVTLRGLGAVGVKLACCDRLIQSRVKLVLFTTRRIWDAEVRRLPGLDWSVPVQVPWSRQRLLVRGVRENQCST